MFIKSPYGNASLILQIEVHSLVDFSGRAHGYNIA